MGAHGESKANTQKDRPMEKALTGSGKGFKASKLGNFEILGTQDAV